MKKEVRNFVRLTASFSAVKYPIGGAVDRAFGPGTDLPDLKAVHDFVRKSADYYAYSTYQISAIHDGEREHLSAPFNHSATIKFGDLKRAQDVTIMTNPRVSNATCAYTDRHPDAMDTMLFVGGGRIEKTEPGDHIYDRDTGKRLQGRPRLSVIP